MLLSPSSHRIAHHKAVNRKASFPQADQSGHSWNFFSDQGGPHHLRKRSMGNHQRAFSKMAGEAQIYSDDSRGPSYKCQASHNHNQEMSKRSHPAKLNKNILSRTIERIVRFFKAAKQKLMSKIYRKWAESLPKNSTRLTPSHVSFTRTKSITDGRSRQHAEESERLLKRAAPNGRHPLVRLANVVDKAMRLASKAFQSIRRASSSLTGGFRESARKYRATAP